MYVDHMNVMFGRSPHDCCGLQIIYTFHSGQNVERRVLQGCLL